MHSFEYIAWDQGGNSHTGLKQANSQEDVLSVLREQGLTPVSVSAIVNTQLHNKSRTRYKKVKSIDMATFCWQLGTMIEGGLSITVAMQTIAGEMENKYFREILGDIASNMEKGEPLSACISRYPKVFNALSCSMITAGETGGTLTVVLARLSEYYTNRDKIVRKVRGALSYPIFVVVFIVLIVIALMTFIIPRFMVLFDQFKGELPAFTRGFMCVYNTIVHNVLYIGIFAILAVIITTAISRTKAGHYQLCRLAISMPVMGKIKLQAFVSVFCKTLSTLVRSGVPILDAFEILTGMTNNDILQEGIRSTRTKMVEGSNIADSMTTTGLFPNVAIKMVQIGEGSGSLASVLEKTSEYYERKVDLLISTMLGLLEPILIVSVGAIVLTVVLAMYLPIFSMKV